MKPTGGWPAYCACQASRASWTFIPGSSPTAHSSMTTAGTRTPVGVQSGHRLYPRRNQFLGPHAIRRTQVARYRTRNGHHIQRPRRPFAGHRFAIGSPSRPPRPRSRYRSWFRSLRDLAERDAERLGDALAVSGIRLQAVADVADRDLDWSVPHGPGGVLEEHLLLPRGDDDPEQ